MTTTNNSFRFQSFQLKTLLYFFHAVSQKIEKFTQLKILFNIDINQKHNVLLPKPITASNGIKIYNVVYYYPPQSFSSHKTQ